MLSPKKLVFSLAIFFTLLVIWVQGATIFNSGQFDRQGNLVFYNFVLFHDSNVHLSLIAELSHRFPPTNFSFGGGVLKNYHYLFDVTVALLHKLSGVSILDLYFRITPIALSLFLSLAIYGTVFSLTKNRLASAFGIFFTVFATSWGAVMPAVKQIFGARAVIGGSNLFMNDQLLNMLVNPQGQLSIIVFLILFLLLHQYERTRKLSSLAVFSLILGLSFGVKAYGGIIFAPAALVVALYFGIKNRDWRVLVFVGAGLVIMAIWIFKTIDTQVAGLKFAPFWLLDHMMSDLDKLNEPRFLLLKEHFQSVGSWWHLGLMNILSFTTYVVGSLGLRLLGVLAIIKFVARPDKIFPSTVFLLTAALLSLLIPAFFNQTKKAYDVVQFTPYFTVFMGVMFSASLFVLLDKFKSKLVKATILAIFVVVILFLDEREIRPRFEQRQEKIVIPQTVIAATDFVRTKTPTEAIFLLAPSEFNRNYLWFSSLAQRRTAYSGLDFAFQVGADSDDLFKRWQQLFRGETVPTKFDYVFIPSNELILFDKIKEHYRLTTVFENSQVQVAQRLTK